MGNLPTVYAPTKYGPNKENGYDENSPEYQQWLAEQRANEARVRHPNGPAVDMAIMVGAGIAVILALRKK